MFSNYPRLRKLSVLILALGATGFLASGPVAAQQNSDSYFRVTPYLWMLGLDGTTAVLGQDTDVDASFSDILDVLNIALSVNMEWNTRGNWFFVLDPMWSELEMDFAVPSPPAPLPINGKVEIELIIMDAHVGYEINDYFDIYAGGRYYDQDITIVPSGAAPAIPLGDDWTDFVVGLRAKNRLGDKWSFSGRLDGAVAGDSDSAWYLQILFLRHFGENKHLDLGWRYYDVDYTSGSGISTFKWDVAHSGPAVGFSWHF
jgi:hypothetical protein